MLFALRMPYTDAAIHEIQRVSDIAPLLMHANGEEDIELEGFTIPKVFSTVSL